MFLPIKSDKSILALGSEFDTRLAFYKNGEIIFSENTGKIAENYEKLEKFIFDFVETHCNVFLRNQIPDIIITDLHPLYNSRKIGEKLAEKFKIPHLIVQHHIAHIFSAVADSLIHNTKYKIQDTDFYGITCDGTGYGLDGNIWGGEVFRISSKKISPRINANGAPFQSEDNFWQLVNTAPREITRKKAWDRRCYCERIGHLEEQYLIGSELAVEEPARMLISILSKFLSKKEIFQYVKKYYSAREFDLIWNQLEQKFNCPLSSSAGRVLDAVSILLGFCENGRKYKHYPVKMLEENSEDCGNLPVKPKITKNKNGEYILNTTELFKYLIENINKTDQRGLGAVAQRYIIEGLYEIAGMDYKTPFNPPFEKGGKLKNVFFSGGLAENKIMKKFARENNIYVSKKIPSGDEGIAIGQIMAFLLFHPRNCQNNLAHL
ncbi:MAG: hypothetical protein V1655_01495 [bacterium]